MTTENGIRMWWYADEINFGDQLNPFLVHKMTGSPPRFTPPKDPALKHLVIGSILQGDMSRCIIWGSGLINLERTCTPPHKIHAVRGPLTRTVLLERGIPCPDIYGDPALLLPFFFHPKTEKKYKIGLIPHYVDQEHPWLKQFEHDKNVIIIDVRKPVEHIIKDILSCESIASSSLHGIIVADAYGIPTCWLEFSDKVLGKGFKFKDYFLSLEIEPSKPLQIKKNTQLRDVLKRMRQYAAQGPCQALLKACPFYRAQGTTEPALSPQLQQTYTIYDKEKNALDTSTEDQSCPMVSIIIPTVNRTEQILKAIFSVENQTYENIEIVLVNDGGPNLSYLNAKLPDSLQKKIVFVNLPRNYGRSYARNAGIKASSGEFLVYLDDDDHLYPNHIATLVHALQRSNSDVAYTDANRAFKMIKDGKQVTYKIDRPYSEPFDRKRFLKENYIPIHCVMHHRRCINDVGGFDVNIMRTEDWDLWLRMSRKYDFIHIPEVTCEYSWEAERQPSSERGGWEPYCFAALHMYHKYKKYIKNDHESHKIHAKAIDNAILNITKALTYAIKKNEFHPAVIFGNTDIDYIRSSFRIFPTLYPERKLPLEALRDLFEVYSRLNMPDTQIQDVAPTRTPSSPQNSKL